MSTSSVTLGESRTYLNWVKTKNEEKVKEERIKLYEFNRNLLQQRLQEEKRKVLSELSFWKWTEKKDKEMREKKLLLEKETKIKEERELLEERNQEMRELKHIDWISKKQLEERIKKEEIICESLRIEREKACRQQEKEQSECVWKLWLQTKKDKLKDDLRKKEQEKMMQEAEKQEKKAMAEKCFQDWLKRTINRPKPVPSNQGFKSLSCTNIGYVNPVPWKNILDDDDSEKLNYNETEVKVLYFNKPKKCNSHITAATRSIKSNTSKACLERTTDWVNCHRLAYKQPVLTNPKSAPGFIDTKNVHKKWK